MNLWRGMHKIHELLIPIIYLCTTTTGALIGLYLLAKVGEILPNTTASNIFRWVMVAVIIYWFLYFLLKVMINVKTNKPTSRY